MAAPTIKGIVISTNKSANFPSFALYITTRIIIALNKIISLICLIFFESNPLLSPPISFIPPFIKSYRYNNTTGF